MSKQLSATMQKPEFLTVKEVAALLRMKPRTIYDLVAQRKIPFRKPGGKLIFEATEIERWTREATPEAMS